MRAIGRATGWLACLCTAATALAASALPTPPLEEPSLVAALGLTDKILVIGNVAGSSAGWTSIPRPLFATFEPWPVEAASVSGAAAGSNQPGDEGAGLLDSQLEFVAIAGVVYNTGLGSDPAACGLPALGQACVAIYDGLLEAALAWANEAQYLVN